MPYGTFADLALGISSTFACVFLGSNVAGYRSVSSEIRKMMGTRSLAEYAREIRDDTSDPISYPLVGVGVRKALKKFGL